MANETTADLIVIPALPLERERVGVGVAVIDGVSTTSYSRDAMTSVYASSNAAPSNCSNATQTGVDGAGQAIREPEGQFRMSPEDFRD